VKSLDLEVDAFPGFWYNYSHGDKESADGCPPPAGRRRPFGPIREDVDDPGRKTANALDEDVQRSLQVGMNAHLSRPVEPERLYQTLEELIWESDQVKGTEA